MSELSELKPWQLRVEKEHAELQERVEALTSFIMSHEFDALDKEERRLLAVQLSQMLRYRNTLRLRIRRFGGRVNWIGAFALEITNEEAAELKAAVPGKYPEQEPE